MLPILRIISVTGVSQNIVMRTFKYKSNSPKTPDKEYTVTVEDDGGIHCNCRGFWTPNKCWHYRDVKQEMAMPVSEIDQGVIRGMMDEDCEEFAIEFAFALYPSMTRDEAVDLVNRVMRDYEKPV